MIYVDDEEAHYKRFGSRVEGGTLDPSKNKYIRNFHNIRSIQQAIFKDSLNNRFIKVENSDVKKTQKILSK